jgi:hypothetical protein
MPMGLGEPLRFVATLLARVGLSAPSRTYISLRFIYARGSATIPLATFTTQAAFRKIVQR